MHRIAAALLLALPGSAPVPAAQSPSPDLPDGVTTEMVAKGKSLYFETALCTACHGRDGKGLIGPNLTDSVWVNGKGSFEEIVGRITNGMPADSSANGSVMPPLGGSNLAPDQVRMIAAYVWTLSHPGKKP